MLHIFPEALHIPSDPRGNDVQPKEIFPSIQNPDHHQHRHPSNHRSSKLHPNSPTQFLISNRGVRPKKSPNKEKRREKEPHRQFQNRRRHSGRSRLLRMNKRPQLIVPLRGKMGVVDLVCRSVKTETHQTHRPNNQSVDLIQKPTFPKQPMRRLMKPNQHPVHQMAGNQHQRNRDPIVVEPHRKPKGELAKQ